MRDCEDRGGSIRGEAQSLAPGGLREVVIVNLLSSGPRVDREHRVPLMVQANARALVREQLRDQPTRAHARTN